MSVAIGNIKGVTTVLEGKLKGLGIDNSDELLEKANTPAARRELATKLGIDAKVVLELANRADLVRIKGVAGVFSDLLENAGVDTVAELARRVPDNLQARLKQIDEEKKLATRVPSLEMVAAWVAEAKTLPKKLEY